MSACDPELGSLISLDELSRRTKLSPRLIRKLIREDGLPVYRVGRWARVIPAEFREWLEARRMSGSARPPSAS